MLGSGWQNRGQSRLGYAAELEKLKPAENNCRLSCSPCAEGWLSNGEGRMIEQWDGYWKLGFVLQFAVQTVLIAALLSPSTGRVFPGDQ